MDKFEVSVVIPMFNAEKTILSSLESVLNQTLLPSEVIIINDGCTDNSLDIVNKFIIKNSSLKSVVVNKTNQGVSKARNDGLRKANHNWIAFLDSDDTWLPDKLQRQKEAIEKLDILFIGCNRNNEKFTNFFGYKFSEVTEITPKMLLLKNFFATPTVLFNKKIIDTVGYFDENQNYCEDLNYWLRIASSKFKCYLINESLVITGDNKPHFGHIGLSSNLKEMASGDRSNMILGYKLGVVNFIEFFIMYLYSWLKYFRRIIIVKLLR